MKNYVLQDEHNELKFSGVAFKSSQKPTMYDTVKEQLAELKLGGASYNEIVAYIKKVMHIDMWSIAELTMRRQISRYPHQYKNPNDLGVRLALMGDKYMGIEPEPHTQYEYVFATKGLTHTSGYALAALAERGDLNEVSYRSMINDLCGLFGWKHISRHYVKDPDQGGLD